MSTRKVSRKDFLKVAGTAAGGAVLASCAPQAVPTATSVPPTAAPTAVAAPATPSLGAKYGGVLTMWFPPPQHDLSFFVYNSRRKAIPFKLIYNNLFRWTNDLSELVPDFAESWDWNTDQTVITFNLRKNAKFHDGEPATAEDVKFSYEIVANPATGSRWVAPVEPIVGAKEYSEGKTDSIEGIKVIDDTTISFEFVGPAPGVFYGVFPMIPVVPKHILGSVEPENMPEHEQIIGLAIGTGPFQVTKYVEGEYREFMAHEDYFLGRPYLDQINQILVDRTVISPALETGALLVGGPLTPYLAVEDVHRLDAQPNLKRFMGPSNIVNQWGFHMSLPERIRKACILACDRETICRDALASLYTPYHTLFTTPWLHDGNSTWGTVPGMTTYPHDPDRARELVQEAIAAGEWSADSKMKWATSSAEPGHVEVLLQTMMRDVGVDSVFEATDGATHSVKLYEEHDFHIVGPGGSSGGTDPDFLASNFTTGASWNHSEYSNPEVDELFEKGRQSWDVAERKPIYQKIARIINEALPRAMLWLRVNLWYVDQHLQDATFSDYGEIVTYDAVHKWWLEK